MIDVLTFTPPPNSVVLSFDEKAKIAIKVWNFFHPRFHIVYTPTKASWMNMIERVFSKFDIILIMN